MRMSTRLLGGASAYAHLAGLVPLRGKRAEEDDKDDAGGKKSRRAEGDDDEDEPKGKKSRADGDSDQYPDDDDSEPKGKKSRRAEDDDDEDEPKGKKSRAAEDDDEDDEPKGRKARAEDDEDDADAEDDDEEMTGKSAVAKARGRERARCKAIFAHPVAAQNVALAASLAFDTTMTRKAAIAVMQGQAGRGGDRGDYRSDRRARNPDLGAGGGAPVTGAKAQTQSWDAALGKAGVKPRAG